MSETTHEDLLTLRCRYGLLTFPSRDAIVGASLRAYGEWAQCELELLLKLLSPGDIVVDAGAYVGTHTLAFADRVGHSGRVLAFEAQPAVRSLLRSNASDNGLDQVFVPDGALSEQRSQLHFPEFDLSSVANFAGFGAHPASSNLPEPSPTITVDAFPLDDFTAGLKLQLVKLDVEGMEVPVLRGATESIRASRPHIYVECSSVSNGIRIFEFLCSQGYRVFMHRAQAFNPENFFRNSRRLFGLACETNLLAITFDRLPQLGPVLDTDINLLPVDSVDDLARHHYGTIRWGEPEWPALSQHDLIARLTHSIEERLELERRLKSTSAELKSALDAATRFDQESASLRANLVRGERRLTEVHRDLDSARGEAATLRAALSKTQQMLAEAHDNLDSSRSEAIELQARLETAQRRFEALDAEFRASLEAQEVRNREATLENRQLSASLNVLREEIDQMVDVTLGTERAVTELATMPPWALDDLQRLCDEGFYRGQLTDAAPANGLVHYLVGGAREGLRPNRLFDTAYYLNRNADVAQTGINPLVHYVTAGAYERRDPHLLFDTEHYISQLRRDVARLNPLLHYVTEGCQELDPHPLFQTAHYMAQFNELGDGPEIPLSHFIEVGSSAGFDPHPLFDTSYYSARVGDALAGVDALSHFLSRPATEVVSPHPFFNTRDYFSQAPEIAETGVNPLVHFIKTGRAAGLRPCTCFDLAEHKYTVTELDHLRLDGRPVALLLGPASDHAARMSLESLARDVSSRCVLLHLGPIDPQAFGSGMAGTWGLSAPATTAPGLVFDPAQQLLHLATVVRGLGVERSFVLASMRPDPGQVGFLDGAARFLEELGMPFDLVCFDLLGGVASESSSPQAPHAARATRFLDRIRGVAPSWSRSARQKLDLTLAERAHRIITSTPESALSIGRKVTNTRILVMENEEQLLKQFCEELDN